MLGKRNTFGRQARADTPALPPPDLRALDVRPFTIEDRTVLSAWLDEDGWPRATMNFVTLEAHLVALLVWPVDVSPGVWLPPIWGDQGWKVPTKIASPNAYRKFVTLIVSFMQHLDREFSLVPARFVPTLVSREFGLHSGNVATTSWAQAFMRALLLGSRGLHWRSDTAKSAILRIARYASSDRTSLAVDSEVASELSSAVLSLVGERASRGPLGALVPHTPDGRSVGHAAPDKSELPLPRTVVVKAEDFASCSPMPKRATPPESSSQA